MFKKILSLLTLSLALPLWAQDTLTIYTYDSFASDWGPGPTIKTAFEKECDCQVKFVALADGVSLLNRLKMEGKNSAADIVLGLDNNLLDAAEKTGLFVPQTWQKPQLDLPIPWKNPTFLPYDYGYFAFVYNQQTLQQPPTSLKQLVEGKQPWKVIYQDPRTSTPGLGLLLWMQKVYGEGTPDAWQKLATKTVTVTKGWSESYGLFLKGEADLVLSYTTSPAYHWLEEQDTRYQAATFSEGHYLQIEVAGQLAASRHPKLAQAFLKFMLTPAFQDVIPTKNWMYPVLASSVPEAFKALPKPTHTLVFSSEEVAQSRQQWVQSWQHAVSR